MALGLSTQRIVILLRALECGQNPPAFFYVGDLAEIASSHHMPSAMQEYETK
jgi:hypothetical protein